jgi:hypothetical protein
VTASVTSIFMSSPLVQGCTGAELPIGGKFMRLAKAFLAAQLCVLSMLAVGITTRAQVGNSSTIEGTVSDPSGAVVANVTVTLHNPVSGLDHSATTDSSGNFTFSNVPFNPYHLAVAATGFAPMFRMSRFGPACHSI